MGDVLDFLEGYSFDKAFLGSVLIEFKDDKDEAIRQLVGLVAADEVDVSRETDVGKGRRGRLKEQTKDLPILRKDDDSTGVLAFELS